VIGLEPRKKPIANAEWVVTLQLLVNDEPVGDARELRYADSYLAKQPRNVGYLIASFINERAEVLAPKKKGRRK
jgi:hypothetical protein